MARVFSWKLKNGKYGYIFKVNGNSHIAGRLPDATVSSMINGIENYSQTEYKAAFDEMNAEVRTMFGGEVTWKDDYYNNTGWEGNIIIFNNQDAGSGSGSGGGEGSSSDSVYDDFLAAIDEKLNAAREELENTNKEAMASITEDVAETIQSAQDDLAKTKKDLETTKKELTESLSAATNAMNAAADLFKLDESQINAESIEAVMELTKEHNEWMTEYSGCVIEMKNDYDVAARQLGEIIGAESVVSGAFSTFAQCLNETTQTVGTVKEDFNASKGSIEFAATWINTSGNTACDAGLYIDANKAQIDQWVNFMNGEGDVTTVNRMANAVSGIVADSVKTQNASEVVSMQRKMDAMDKSITDTINAMNETNTKMTSLGVEMNATKKQLNSWITDVNYLSGTTSDLRDAWSTESGMLRSVSTLVANTDENGEVIYYYLEENASGTKDKVRVYQYAYINNKDEYAVDYYTERNGKGIKVDADKVTADFSVALSSYIKQTASAITLSVSNNSGATAGIIAEIEGNSGFIKMIADEVQIDADVIAKAITAGTADIGGIILENGKISCMKTEAGTKEPLFLLNGHDGSLKLKGEITATKLDLAGTAKTEFEKSISDQVQSSIGSNVDSAITKYLEDNPIEAGSDVKVIESADTNGVKYKIVTVKNGSETIEYKTYTTDDSPYIYWGKTGSDEQYVQIKKDGLLEAKNALIYGTIYATDGSFKGDIEARSLTLTGEAKTNFDNSISTQVNNILGDNVTAAVEDYMGSHQVEKGSDVTITDETDENGISYKEIKVVNGSKTSTYKTYTTDDSPYLYWGKVYSGSTDGKTSYTKIDKDGLLQAKNALIYGTIHANAGDIGGFTIEDNCLQMKGEDGNIKGLVNAGEHFKSSNDGVLMFAAGASGISETNILYKWVCDSIPSGLTTNVLWTDIDYSESGRTYYLGQKVMAYPEIADDNIDFNYYEVELSNLDGTPQIISESAITIPLNTETGVTHSINFDFKRNSKATLTFEEDERPPLFGQKFSIDGIENNEKIYEWDNRSSQITETIVLKYSFDTTPHSSARFETIFGYLVFKLGNLDIEQKIPIKLEQQALLGAPMEFKLADIDSMELISGDDIGVINKDITGNTYVSTTSSTKSVSVKESGTTKFDVSQFKDLTLIGSLSGVSVGLSVCSSCGNRYLSTKSKCDKCGAPNTSYVRDFLGDIDNASGMTDLVIGYSSKTFPDPSDDIISLKLKNGYGEIFYFTRIKGDAGKLITNTLNYAQGNFAATRIYENGSLYTKRMFAEEGIFKGVIKAGGEFSGEFNQASGTITRATITNSSFEGDLRVSDGGSLSIDNSDGKTMFNVGSFEIKDNQINSEAQIYSISESPTNYSNRYASYGPGRGGVAIASTTFERNAKITIPSTTISFTINSPKLNHDTPAPWAGLVANVYYKNGRSAQFSLLDYQQFGWQNNYSVTYTRDTNQKIIDCGDCEGTVVLILQYEYTLRDHHWWNYASARMSFNAKNNLKVNYEQQYLGENFMARFGKNGFMASYGPNTTLTMLENFIELECGNYGLKVTNNGVSIKRGNDWVGL